MRQYSLEQTFSSTFDLWWESFLRDPRIIRLPKMPDLVFLDDQEKRWTAQLLLKKPVIRISRSFLGDIQGAVEKHAQVLTRACLIDLDPNSKTHDAEARLLPCVLDATASFVLLHELFHMFCGHWDVLRSRPSEGNQSLSLDEASLGLAETNSRDRTRARAEDDDLLPSRCAYYVEMEADNTALQWLMQAAPPDSLAALLSALWPNESNEPLTSIADLDGPARILVFRLLFAASWLVVLLIEQKRPEALLKDTRSHPLPAARLLAGMFTLMEQFAELDNAFIGESGYKTLTLSDREVEDMVLCLRKVIAPVLKAPWPASDPASASEGLVAFSPPLITELRNILLQKPPETKPGDELEKIEQLRLEMATRFRPYRYFTP